MWKILQAGLSLRSLRSRGMGRAQEPRQRGGRVVTSPAGLRARRCGRSSRPRRLRRVSGVRVFIQARRGGGGLRFPPPWFSPRRPPFGGAPFPSADHRPGGKPIPVHSLRSFTGGNRTAAIFVFFAAALRVPPPEIPRRSLNTPVPPQSCGGRSRVRRRSASRTAPALRGLRSPAPVVLSFVESCPAPSASLSLAPPCGHFVATPNSPPVGLAGLSRTLPGTFRASPGNLASRGTRRARLRESAPVTSGCGCAARSVAGPGTARRLRVRFVSKPGSLRGLWKTKCCEREGGPPQRGVRVANVQRAATSISSTTLTMRCWRLRGSRLTSSKTRRALPVGPPLRSASAVPLNRASTDTPRI